MVDLGTLVLQPMGVVKSILYFDMLWICMC